MLQEPGVFKSISISVLSLTDPSDWQSVIK